MHKAIFKKLCRAAISINLKIKPKSNYLEKFFLNRKIMTKFNYPEARRDEKFTEIYHGVEVRP